MNRSLYLSAGVVLAFLLAFGCASAPKGPTDLELVQMKTQECVAAANAKDLDKLMSNCSEEFLCAQIGDKAAFKAFLEDAKQAGFLNGVEISVQDAKTTIQNGIATIVPVKIHGSFGTGEATFTAKKEKGEWKITAMDVSGI